LLDQQDLRTSLPRKLRDLATKASAEDTIVLFAAGHGLREPTGEFSLATPSTNLKQIRQSALSWKDVVAALDGAKARVVVFLDACHSGATEGATNDDAVASLLHAHSSMVVIAASKGRQYSIEEATLGGGVFTSVLKRLLATDRAKTDVNGNGAIELSELYGALKRQVVAITKGEQTPWIARNQTLGEVPLF
jgi:uncharacterized caspase-like protein